MKPSKYQFVDLSEGINSTSVVMEDIKDLSGIRDHLYSEPFENDTQQIIDDSDDHADVIINSVDNKQQSCSKRRAYATVFVLLFVNLLNYMDRFTVAGVLTDIERYYNVQDTKGGLLQTSFICSYMVLSPIFGYLGDRYPRKPIMACGLFFWAGITLAGSFIPASQFGFFIIMRGLVGVGEASYSTIAPTIIADLFAKDQRTKMLALFYFAIPVGSGLGYIVGSNFAAAFGHWQYALRFTPALGVLAVFLIMFVVYEPERGASEGGTKLVATGIKADLLYLIRNKSFVLSTMGFTAVAFVTGALALWAPTLMLNAIHAQGEEATESSVALKFGIITVAAGLLGVGLGSESGRRLRVKYPNADPLVCAFGLMTCSPFLFFALVVGNKSTILTWILIFIGETLLCLNWALVTDILLYVVIPTRRSTAEAANILISHLFGDAGSPYLVGVVADIFRGKKNNMNPVYEFEALQKSLYMTAFVSVLGSGCFLATSLFVKKDRALADAMIHAGTAEISASSVDEDVIRDGKNVVT